MEPFRCPLPELPLAPYRLKDQKIKTHRIIDLAGNQAQETNPWPPSSNIARQYTFQPSRFQIPEATPYAPFVKVYDTDLTSEICARAQGSHMSSLDDTAKPCMISPKTALVHTSSGVGSNTSQENQEVRCNTGKNSIRRPAQTLRPTDAPSQGLLNKKRRRIGGRPSPNHAVSCFSRKNGADAPMIRYTEGLGPHAGILKNKQRCPSNQK